MGIMIVCLDSGAAFGNHDIMDEGLLEILVANKSYLLLDLVSVLYAVDSKSSILETDVHSCVCAHTKISSISIYPYYFIESVSTNSSGHSPKMFPSNQRF